MGLVGWLDPGWDGETVGIAAARRPWALEGLALEWVSPTAQPSPWNLAQSASRVAELSVPPVVSAPPTDHASQETSTTRRTPTLRSQRELLTPRPRGGCGRRPLVTVVLGGIWSKVSTPDYLWTVLLAQPPPRSDFPSPMGAQPEP